MIHNVNGIINGREYLVKVLNSSDTVDFSGLGRLHQRHANCGGVAQLVRALACHARGRGFESRHSRHFVPYLPEILCKNRVSII